MFVLPKEPLRKAMSLSIVLCGQAGAGIQTVEQLLSDVFKVAGYHVFATKEYMSRVRGGTNSTQIRVSSKPVAAPLDKIDICIPLNAGALEHVEKRIDADTVILAEDETFGDSFDRSRAKSYPVEFTKIAQEIGDKIYSNIVAVGIVTAIFGVDPKIVETLIEKRFKNKEQQVVQKNLLALQAGCRTAKGLIDSGVSIDIPADTAVTDQIVLNGAQAVALGAIAGGCDFISAYPMSPSTGVLIFLAGKADEFGIIAEQAEDEIAAVNMAVGAWYAGARAMVTTSGGGFALMTEGLSLAAMLESPLVIHIAQRPGPATGLPTRTEQGDLDLALYGGHGEFPRIIFAPGTLRQAFELTQKAFDIADKYQLPVFVLTDQYFIDSYYNTEMFNLTDIKVEKHIVKTAKKYKRYELTESGVSPRGIPSFGDGLVCVDSDEHDTHGHITEDLLLRVKMVDKRLAKLNAIKKDALEPELWPDSDYKNLIVCWGSTYHIVKEALTVLNRDDTSLLHFGQVCPLSEKTAEYLKKADKTIVVEGNATAQFARLIKIQTGIDFDDKILKYNGQTFTVEEIAEKISQVLT